MRNNSQFHKEKEVRQLLKRQKEIYSVIRNLEPLPLKEPIRHGWYKELKIDIEIAENYKHSKYIKELCNKLEKSIWGRTKDEAQEKWDKETSRHLIYKEVPTLSPKSYRKLSDPAKRMCVKFQFVEIKPYTKSKKWKTRYYVRLPRSIVNIRFKRAYITHIRQIDPNLESELQEIHQKLNSAPYLKTYRKIIGYNRWKWVGEDYKFKRKKDKRNLYRTLKNIANE